MTRKLTPQHEGIIDNIIYLTFPLFDNFEFFYKCGITPNMITYLSIILCLISGCYIYKKQYKLAALFYILSYYIDCVDGFFARRFNMCTKFGDYLDHISDVSSIIFIIYLLNIQNPFLLRAHLPNLIFFIFVAFIQIGCQEKIYGNNESESLVIFKNICIDTNLIKFTRLFGCGALSVYIYYMIYTFSS